MWISNQSSISTHRLIAILILPAFDHWELYWMDLLSNLPWFGNNRLLILRVFFDVFESLRWNFATSVWCWRNYFNVMLDPLKRDFDFLLGGLPLCLDHITGFAGRLHGLHRNVLAGFSDSKRIRTSACFQIRRDWSNGSRAKCSACYTSIRDCARHAHGVAFVVEWYLFKPAVGTPNAPR